MLKSIIYIMILMLIPAFSLSETIYPPGSNILIDYNLSAVEVFVGDTITISRTFENNESFQIEGLYLSEHIPPEFEIVDYALTNNGENLTFSIDSSAEPIYTGYDYYCWIVDDPSGTLQNNIAPGDSLSLTINIVGFSTGIYSFPLHTSAFVGNSSAYFATDNEYSITVIAPADTTPPSAITDLRAN